MLAGLGRLYESLASFLIAQDWRSLVVRDSVDHIEGAMCAYARLLLLFAVDLWINEGRTNLTCADILSKLDLVLVIVIKCNINRFDFKLVYVSGRTRVRVIFLLFFNLVKSVKGYEADHRADCHVSTNMSPWCWCLSWGALANLFVYKVNRVLRTEWKVLSIITAFFLTAPFLGF